MRTMRRLLTIAALLFVPTGLCAQEVEGESTEARVEFTDPGLARGDYTYARVLQKNRGLAWSSPIWVE